MNRIFAYVMQRAGVIDDTAAELVQAAREIDASQIPTAIVTGSGTSLDTACEFLRSSFGEIWKISNEALAYPNAELIRQILVRVLPPQSIVLISHDHFGVDLAPGLSIKLDCPFVSDLVAIDQVSANSIKFVRQEFGGQISAHYSCDLTSGAVINVRPSVFRAESNGGLSGIVVDKSPEVGLLAAKRRYVETIVAETGDVDITKHSVLVSVGRGIQEKDNVSIAEELAETVGAAVSCSRPVVDAKWLAKSRQVGSSGKTVKPKVYLACGISGAFQHLAGIKGKPFLIAINKNAKAPIFQVADIGVVDDLLEFLPELTNKVRELRGAVAK